MFYGLLPEIMRMMMMMVNSASYQQGVLEHLPVVHGDNQSRHY